MNNQTPGVYHAEPDPDDEKTHDQRRQEIMSDDQEEVWLAACEQLLGTTGTGAVTLLFLNFHVFAVMPAFMQRLSKPSSTYKAE